MLGDIVVIGFGICASVFLAYDYHYHKERRGMSGPLLVYYLGLLVWLATATLLGKI